MLYQALIALSLLTPVHAQPSKPENAQKHEAAEDKARAVPGSPSKGLKACHDDIEQFCDKVIPGEGRIGRCLVANRKKLSKSCLRWASHGGKPHIDASLLEIDKTSPPPR